MYRKEVVDLLSDKEMAKKLQDSLSNHDDSGTAPHLMSQLEFSEPDEYSNPKTVLALK